MIKKIVIIILILLEIVQLLLIGLLIYGRTGYQPFKDIDKKEIAKFTYTVGVHEFEYELPNDPYSPFYSYFKALTVYVPYNTVSFLYTATYGSNHGVLKVYMQNGDVHTIHPSTGRILFGRNMFMVNVDGVVYLTDLWYGLSLARTLSSFSDERKALMKESNQY